MTGDTVTLYAGNRVDGAYRTNIEELRARFEAWRDGEVEWQDCPRSRADAARASARRIVERLTP